MTQFLGQEVSQELILFENQIQTTSTSPCRTQVQPAASFLLCSLIFIEYEFKDNQNDNVGCQDSYIVIVAVKSISDGYVTNTTSTNRTGHSCFPNKGNQGHSRHTNQIWQTF